jgi:two-component system sensor histidine kinase AlgZ
MELTTSMRSFLQRNLELIFHIAFWSVYISFNIYHITSYQTSPQIAWGKVLTSTSSNMIYALAISYVNYFYLVPILIKKQIAKFLIGFSLSFALITLIRFQIDRSLPGGMHYLHQTETIVQMITTNLFIALFVGMFRLASDWLQLDSDRKELEKQKLTAELNFLKAQVNPHFFFNTLNNLYYLAIIKSDITGQAIAKLSEMMRYMIYESNYEKVDLNKEIEYIQNYISLESLRVKGDGPVSFDIEGNTDILITPLILITFLENAFKHGVSSGNNQSWIKAKLEVKNTSLLYSVQNSKVNGKPKSKEKTGIGLHNVKRRLELSYPGKHSLTIQDEPDYFNINLSIDLT